MNIKLALAATAVALALPQVASASVVITSSTPYGYAAITGTNVVTFDSDSAPYKVSGAAKILHGSATGVYAAPAVAPGQPDDTSYLAAFPSGADALAGTLSGFGLARAVTFLWGSIDTYNALDFYLGDTLVGTVLGSDALSVPTPDLATVVDRTVSVAASSPFDRLVFRTGQNAFEADRFSFQSAVPEPATWGMMVLGMGAVGYAMRSARRGRGVVPAS